MKKSFISVALCTYNGERYLSEQLISIARQDRLPDELVIVDDGSSDNTLALVRQFADTAAFTVRVLENPQNLGSTKSFERAAKACTGDIIVFSDQDDRWREDRLAKTEAYFADNPDMDAVFSDAELINGDSERIGRRIWQEVAFTPEAQTRWNQGEACQMLFFGYVVTGATLAIRRSALSRLTPFPTHIQFLIHDAWISLLLSLHGTIGFIDECLIFYRQHAQQQVGFKAPRPKVTLRDRFTRGREGKLIYVRKTADRYQKLYELLSNQPGVDASNLNQLKRMRDHLAARTHFSPDRMYRIGPIWRELTNGNYQLFGGHWWKTALGDLFED